MYLQVVQHILLYNLVLTLAYEEYIFVVGENTQEIIDIGRTQYQLLRERGSLPKYGKCWTSAIEHLEDGCRNLSEESQSDVALHLTNRVLD